ncbi:transposase [Nonomuraea angiospora]|uniref:transposase n=1 Tax=Nonomuraea angiospora TaxID=46172 RepID=UPI0029BF64F5|nr:transposase [Nonomuraea angiospora]MDX3107519.1 transposase [Nonomuraea angiospora]
MGGAGGCCATRCFARDTSRQGRTAPAQKSVEPMASRLGLPRQNLGHFIAQSSWNYTDVMRRIAARAVAVIDPAAWLIDDHPFVRYGHGTAGAIVQHCGERGQHLCQVAVSIHAVSNLGSTPLHWRLFIPQAWADDPERRTKSGIPPALVHRTKQQLALESVDEAAGWGLRPVSLQKSSRGLDLRVDLVRQYGQDQFLCLSISSTYS